MKRKHRRSLGSYSPEHNVEVRRLYKLLDNAYDEGNKALKRNNCTKAYDATVDTAGLFARVEAHAYSVPKRTGDTLFALNAGRKRRDDLVMRTMSLCLRRP